MIRHNHSQSTVPRGRPVTALEEAHANNSFEHFLSASTLKTILGTYRNICEHLHLKPNVIPQFYPKLKTHVNSWKAKPLWKKFDYRANQKCYGRGKACPNTRVLIIGAGPCGLRTAIEAQLLGAKVVVVEKRDRMSRNNVLHLWPFVIEDLRMLGAKKFFGKFCAGAIDHISIRQLQCILMKVALLLGVEIHTEVSFERLIEPNFEDKVGWRAEFKPSDHPVSQFEFDVIIGADGKRNTLQGFKRKEFRGKLAIAITANFINKRTEAEARVEEISGVAFIFNQKFFKDLHADTGIDLENIVYYKDDTHYFVMTAKKQSLIEKGVIKKDLPDTARLLALDNVDRDELMNYAREAAEFSTNYQMPDLEFAVNHYGQADVAMFDFTSMYAAENASRVIEKHGYKLLSILVGDSLLEPFWPTGSGCARGFLSSMDAAWAIRSWGSGNTTPLEVLSERESIYRLLAQTTPENLNKDYKSYMLDPSTRYPNLNKNVLLPHQVTSLYDTDDPKGIELKPRPAPAISELPKKRRRRESHVDPDMLLIWIKSQVREHNDLEVADITTSFKDGRVLCAILHHYRPDLLDYGAINAQDAAKNNQLAFDLLEKELGVPPVMSGEEMASKEVPDYLTMLSYLTQIYDTFRCEIPHIKHPKLIEDNELFLAKNYTKLRAADERPVNLKPLLITPKSSAIISEDVSTKYKMRSSGSYSSARYTELEEIPTKQAKSNDSDLILIPIKSIENYLSDDVPTAKFVEAPSDFRFNEEISKCADVKRIYGPSKSDTVCSKVKKSKSKISVKCRQPVRAPNIRKRLKKSIKTDYVHKPIFKFCDENFNEISSENATDKARIFVQFKKASRKSSNNAASQTSNGSLNELNELKNVECKDLQPDKASDDTFTVICGVKSTKSSKTNECLKEMSDETVDRNSQSNRSEIRNFWGEMDLYLHYEAFASKKLDELRKDPKKIRENNFKINIKCAKNENVKLYPSEIPDFLLKKRVESPDVLIKNIEHRDEGTVAVQEMRFFSLANCLRIVPRIVSTVFQRGDQAPIDKKKNDVKCQRKFYKSFDGNKFLSDASMSNSKIVAPAPSISKVAGWINSSNFEAQSVISTGQKEPKSETTLNDNDTDITSITKQIEETRKMEANAEIENENAKTKSSTANSHESIESLSKFVQTLKSNSLIKGVSKLTNFSAWQLYEGRTKSKSEGEDQFSTIAEGEESDLPETKRNEALVKVPTAVEKFETAALTTTTTTRQPTRHKRHVDANSTQKPIVTTQDRKTRKRKTLEKVGASVDRESRLPTQTKRETDEDFAARIKDLEDKWRDPVPVEKKPKDLLRAIGKIETSDWNIKEIEKKIIENKLGKTVNKDKEKVPKWSREQFLARQNKMESKHLERQESSEVKFAEIDKNIKQLEQRLKEGSTRDLNQQKVATITEKFGKPIEPQLPKLEKSNSRSTVLPNQGSEHCHFCAKRVYLMERLSAEGKFFHRGCFRCQYCHTLLRLGSYTFDREGLYGNRFYCTQHFGMSGELRSNKVDKKDLQEQPSGTKLFAGVIGVDLLDRVQTPERIEFSNLSTGHVSSDHEESPSPIDEDEWTDRNFKNSVVDSDSPDDSSSTSETDSEDDEAFEEALEEPATKEGTLRWAERYKRRYSRKQYDDIYSDEYSSSDDSSYCENSSGDEESDTATEGEDEIRARELRKQEVRVEPPVTDTGTDTEIASDESCTESSSSEIQNSATEISTDSEFAQDDPTPTRETPKKIFDDYVTKVRGSSGQPKKVQVKSGILQQPMNGRTQNKNIELKFTPLVQTPTVVKKSAPTTLLLNEGYPLNRTQSTGGIATKVSLELKKKYLLGESNVSGSIQKSGSASTLDSKFKLFHTNISDCQKLLKPASEISASMQVFCNKLNERTSPLSPTFASPTKKTELPKIDITKCASESSVKIVNESEGRPRSPVHERSIIVPTIDWEKNKPKFTDSLSSSDSSEFDDKNVTFNNIPRLEVHDDSGEIVQDEAFDSLNVIIINDDARRINEPPKSITTEKKSLNQPKVLPNLDDSILTEMHSALHTKPDEFVKNTSGRSSPSINEDAITAALTETELSDWARDGASDDFEDIPHLDVEKQTELKKPLRAEFGENEQKNNIAECVNSILYPNIDNIEFMDTGTETSSDDNVEIKNNGYVQFHNEDEFVETPPSNLLANPTIKTIESLQPKLKQNCDNEIVVETGTTTEENTCSDSTVKNITERTPDFKPIETKKFVDNFKDRKRLEDKLVQVKLDMAKLNEQKNLNPQVCEANVEFEEHCQRLQSKIEFSNVKDSIDIRKSRRKSKTESVKPDLIQEEKINSNESKTLNLMYKKEEIEKERNINQKLVQEMVMNKMRAQNKSLERKKRVRNSFSPIRSFELSKSATIDVASRVSPLFAAPDVLLSTIPPPLQKSQTITNILDDTFKTPKAPPRLKNEEAKKTAEKLKENARARVRLLSDEDLGLSPEDKIQKLKLKVKKNVDVHIQDSIESLVINTERRNSLLYNDTLKRNTSFRRSKSGDGRLNSQSSYDLTGKLSVAKAPEVERTKSVSDINKPQNFATAENAFCKSDPNLLMDGRKKKKDRERRKSITKFLADIFVKRNSSNKSFLSRISPKSKNKSKSCVGLDQEDIDKNLEEPALRRNSISEVNLRCEVGGNVSPPPIPPLPVNYTGSYLSKDESSDAENDFKRHDRSSCDTLDQSGVHDGSVSSFNARRSSRGARKAVRQAQLKRHRMAQEIQRKLEETEVKTKELENRGVAVEKALRGESNGSMIDSGREESDLLKEWFDLMRDRTELRRYERELMVQAQELELEDRHARLQHELRERLEDDEPKTAEKMEVEGSIIKEMMEIVSKRDSLITLLEEDRIRYSEEDRDFEEQMLAKGIHLTPLAKPLDQ